MKNRNFTLSILVILVTAVLVGFSLSSISSDRDIVTESIIPTNTIEQYNSTIGTISTSDDEAILYNQSELVSNPGAGAGGADASAITDPGTLFGFGNQITASNRMADDFTIPGGETWTIDSIIVFHYQTGSTTTSTINAINLQIWDGATPGTGSIVAGDSTTNRMGATYFSNIYRVTSTTLTNNQRPIMRSQVNMSGATLSSGTYWIDYCAGGTLASGPWNPPRTIVGQPNTGNAYQRTGTTWTWAPAVDGANPQGVPFIIYGSVGGGTNESILTRGGLNLSIPDNNPVGVADSIIVTGGGNVLGVEVVIDTTIHTWVGDLKFTLTHNGVTDTLISRMGTGTFGLSQDNLINVWLKDTASKGIWEAVAADSTPLGGFRGSWRPGYRFAQDSLSKFVGMPANGSWVLRVSDNAGGDLGTLRRWTLRLTTTSTLTTVTHTNTATPDAYELSQNYPNPFNPVTKINFSLPKSEFVTLKIYDVTGKEVATLVNELRGIGTHTVEFNAATLASGAYFYTIQAGDYRQVKKMMLLK